MRFSDLKSGQIFRFLDDDPGVIFMTLDDENQSVVCVSSGDAGSGGMPKAVVGRTTNCRDLCLEDYEVEIFQARYELVESAQ